MNESGICIIIPTYNNMLYLPEVIDSVSEAISATPRDRTPSIERIIVVNDGSTDDTERILQRYARITLVSCPQNKGKGYALRLGFDKAEAMGYRYAITMDSDGQHSACDLSLFERAVWLYPDSMIIGSRHFNRQNMPKKNMFANRFSNFWFMLQTGRYLPDTQTGFRLYPLKKMKGLRPFTSRYEAELELLVRAAWKNIPQIPVPVQAVYYAADKRITHFRPLIDFLRISLLNTFLCFLAVVYGYPSRFIRYWFDK
ncbi:MAG: glycosyltransferase family 2 protein [Dysgonamonadaceae bacterium]|jgi:glycosyltransferase involved in cell wall biosynthesis|nr:glycosyltransferase family 2 protein [Dysgonamonadaceae bacterium]